MRVRIIVASAVFVVLSSWMGRPAAQQKFDLLLRGGHVIDPRNRISAVRDVAISGGRVAAVAARLNPADALKVVDVSGTYVTPGLVDIHVHVYAGTGERGSYAGDNSVYPDGFTFRSGVTTVADAGCAGWRNFEDFKQRIIDRSKTRVLALLNIVGHGMRGGAYEQDLTDMDAKPTADMARRYKDVVVGVKTAHYAGPEWTPVERAVEAGTLANIPVMVDFGTNRPERPMPELVTRKLRPGDIYTHVYSGLRNEQDDSGRVNPALWEARKRGVIFDVGHGGGSFAWRIAAPAVKEGFLPDSISTDLHVASMNSGMKDMLNVMDKFLAMGLSIDDVIAKSTWNPAREIKHEELGHLSPGAVADVAVLRVEKGAFGFVDMYGARLRGTQKLVCELTLRDGKVVYDLNGLTRPDWDALPKDYRQTGDARWDAITPAPVASPGRSGRSGAAAGDLLVYFGTYTGANSKGIYRSRLDVASARLSPPELAAETANPSFLAAHPAGNFLFAVNEVGEFEGSKSGSVSAFAVDRTTGGLRLLNQQASAGAGPAHLVVDPAGRDVLVANYGGGSVAVLPIGTDGRLQPASAFVQHTGSSVNPQRQSAPHAHAVAVDAGSRFAYVADLGVDRIFIYRLDAGVGSLAAADPPFARLEPGAGPRHVALHPRGDFAYAINELACTITVFRRDAASGGLTAVQTVSTLPANEAVRTGYSTAEILVHPNGRFLYGSNRGHDSLVVFAIDESSGRLTCVEHQPSGGSTPRGFGIDPGGTILLAANQRSDNVVVFRIDPQSGRLTPTGQQIAVGSPVCVTFVRPR